MKLTCGDIAIEAKSFTVWQSKVYDDQGEYLYTRFVITLVTE